MFPVGDLRLDLDLGLVNRKTLSAEIARRQRMKLMQRVADPPSPARLGNVGADAALVDVNNVRDRRSERAEHRAQVEDDDIGYAEPLSYEGAEQWTIAAVGEQRHRARAKPPLF